MLVWLFLELTGVYSDGVTRYSATECTVTYIYIYIHRDIALPAIQWTKWGSLRLVPITSYIGCTSSQCSVGLQWRCKSHLKWAFQPNTPLHGYMGTEGQTRTMAALQHLSGLPPAPLRFPVVSETVGKP